MITPYSISQKYLGRKEVAGAMDDPAIMQWLRLDHAWPSHDEVPWCSAFVNYMCFLAGIVRTKNLMARSWLGVGRHISIEDAEQGFDVVVLKRGGADQPGPENMTAPGHVGFYAFHHDKQLFLLGGNQSDAVSIATYPLNRILGVRRLEL